MELTIAFVINYAKIFVKGGRNVENSKKIIAYLAKRVTKKTLVHSANSTTCFTIYQPIMPKKLGEFKKNK